MSVPEFRCGDVVCELGQGVFGRLIQRFTRGLFEAKTWASHAGRIVTAGDTVMIAEALRVFTIQPLDTGRRIKVWRHKAAFSEETLDCLWRKALYYKGKSYGWWKNAAHAIDGFLQKVTPFKHVYLFRRLIGVTDYPICSWEVAWTMSDCAGYRFGLAPNAASPDDIADWCEAHPDEWELIYDNVTGA